MKCSECNKKKEIVNKHFGLCFECNNIRLHGNPFGKVYENSFKPPKRSKPIKSTRKSIGGSQASKNRIGEAIRLDEEVYEKVFTNKDHMCEECGCELPDHFRDEDGKVIARYQYSHIVPKSIATKEMRRDVCNFNRLCLSCHSEWENGDKESMNIFKENSRKFPEYLIK